MKNTVIPLVSGGGGGGMGTSPGWVQVLWVAACVLVGIFIAVMYRRHRRRSR